MPTLPINWINALRRGGGYTPFVINNTNYYYLAVDDFAGDQDSGYLEALVYYDGIASHQYLFTSCDDDSIKRYIKFRLISGRPIFQARQDSVFTTQVQADVAMSVGWHTVRFISTGSAYSILVDGAPIAITMGAGLNDGKWFSSVSSAGLLRRNIAIGINYDSVPITYSDEFQMKYVDFNGTNKWVAKDV